MISKILDIKLVIRLQVRRQNNFIVGDGSTAVPQDIIETVENITVAHQYHALIAYTVQDLTLRIEDFSPHVYSAGYPKYYYSDGT